METDKSKLYLWTKTMNTLSEVNPTSINYSLYKRSNYKRTKTTNLCLKAEEVGIEANTMAKEVHMTLQHRATLTNSKQHVNQIRKKERKKNVTRIR